MNEISPSFISQFNLISTRKKKKTKKFNAKLLFARNIFSSKLTIKRFPVDRRDKWVEERGGTSPRNEFSRRLPPPPSPANDTRPRAYGNLGSYTLTGLDLYLYKGVTKNRHISTGAPCCMPRLRPYWGCSTGLKPRLNHQSFVMLFTNKPPPLTARFNAGEEEGRDTISRVEPRIRHVVLATCSISVLSTSKRLEIERILVVDNSTDRFRFENQ